MKTTNHYTRILFFSLSSFLAQAQPADWSWARTAYGTYDDQPGQVAVNAAGEVFMTGRYGSSVINFPPMNIPNNGAPNTDEFFLAKYDATGQIQWVSTAYGAGDDAGVAISLDAAGNIYVAGFFESPYLAIM